MRRKLEVRAGGRIAGLSVIGFHGEVDPSHTPGRREAVFADAEGRLVGMEGMEPEGEAARSVLVVTGRQAGEGPLPGMATRFAQAFPAHLGFIVVVVGENERSHADALGTAVTPGGSPSVDAFLRWLATCEAAAPEGLMAQRLGEGAVAWYCGPAEATVLYQRIARVAEKEMVRAACLEDERALYQMSWWRSRVALSDPDRYFAAVGLERSNRSMADAYLKAVLRKRPQEELEAGLVHARRQFDSLCEEARCGRVELAAAQAREGEEHSQSQRAESIIGPLARMRGNVRRPYIVRRAA